MRLLEHQGKELFSKYGIPVPRSRLARDTAGALRAAEEVGLPAVIKAQVLAGGRGKAGAVAVVRTMPEVEREAARVLGLRVGGEPVRGLLVEELLSHSGEIYLSVSLDRGAREFVALASMGGGTEVERRDSREMVRASVPLEGLTEAAAAKVGGRLGLEGAVASDFQSTLLKLERLAREEECELAEVNPLGVRPGGGLVALDSKVVLDDNALFRHPEFSKIPPEDPLEEEAARSGFAFVRLGGDIAVLGNGAGLVLSTIDLLTDLGGRAACFLDLGGGADLGRVEAALTLAGRLPSTRAVLLNIFGGITRTVEVAEAVRGVLSGGKMAPVFARVSGVEEEKARAVLAAAGVKVFTSAAEAVVAAVQGVSR